MSENLKTAKTGFLSKLLSLFTHNWAMKLFSLLLAVVLWAGLITQDTTLTRERVFTDAPVTVTGKDSMQRNNGLILISGLEEDITARFRVAVPQGVYNDVTAANYNPRIDLSRISEPGEQTVKIVTTSTNLYGTVSSITPDSVTVVVDEYVTNYRVPVAIEQTGSYDEGVSGTTPATDPSTVAVSGPKTLVDQIAIVYVDYDLSITHGKLGSSRIALPFRFCDANGNTIESPLLEASSASTILRSISVQQTLYELHEIAVSDKNLITGTPAEGYYVSSVSFTPQKVFAGGSSAVVAELDYLYAESTIDISGISDSFTRVIRIHKPGELSYLSNESITVSVVIKEKSDSRTFDNIKYVTVGLDNSLKASYSTRTVVASVYGPMNKVRNLKAARLEARLDLSGISEPGEYFLTPDITLTDEEAPEAFSFEASTVKVTVSAK